MSYQAPEGTGIGHVHLKVADIDRALAFYQGVLGFDLIMRLGDSAAFVSAGGYHHHIGLNTWHSRARHAAAAAPHRPLSLRDPVSRRARDLASGGPPRHRRRRAAAGRRRPRRQRIDLPGRPGRQRHRAHARSAGIRVAARRRRRDRDAHGGPAGSGRAAARG